MNKQINFWVINDCKRFATSCGFHCSLSYLGCCLFRHEEETGDITNNKACKSLFNTFVSSCAKRALTEQFLFSPLLLYSHQESMSSVNDICSVLNTNTWHKRNLWSLLLAPKTLLSLKMKRHQELKKCPCQFQPLLAPPLLNVIIITKLVHPSFLWKITLHQQFVLTPLLPSRELL